MQQAILDTGSFEAVVLSEECALCPGATYNSRFSKTYKGVTGSVSGTTPMEELGDWWKKFKQPGQEHFEVAKHIGTFMQNIGHFNKNRGKTRMLMFGSGPIFAAPGSDDVTVPGCDALVANEFPILEVVNHAVIVLIVHKMLTSIIGMGPGLQNEMHLRLHHLLGADRFTYCFPKDVSKDGVIVWDDRDPTLPAQPGSWLQQANEVKLVGQRHWGVELNQMKLSGGRGNWDQVVGCDPSCGAVVDSGTSMIALDGETFKKLKAHWDTLTDCSQFHELPSLKFNLGGVEHVLPPEAYVAVVSLCDIDERTMTCEESEEDKKIPERFPYFQEANATRTGSIPEATKGSNDDLFGRLSRRSEEDLTSRTQTQGGHDRGCQTHPWHAGEDTRNAVRLAHDANEHGYDAGWPDDDLGNAFFPLLHDNFRCEWREAIRETTSGRRESRGYLATGLGAGTNCAEGVHSPGR
jgi:hypothetical protein